MSSCSCASPPLSHHAVIPPATTFRHRRFTGRRITRSCLRMSLDNNNNNNNPNLNSSSVLSAVTKLLWGQSLPPGLLVATVRTAWNSTWSLMMSQLAPSDSSGGYSRPASKFRYSGTPPQGTHGLHLYVGLACPWAHRTLIVRALKGLEEAVPVSVASPGPDGSWEFKRVSGADTGGLIISPSLDKANGCKTLREVYKLRRGGYDGRSTVPMLWDKDSKEVICNESYDIIQLFNSGLNGLARNPDLDLSPPELKGKIEEWYRVIYPNVNNGVYR